MWTVLLDPPARHRRAPLPTGRRPSHAIDYSFTGTRGLAAPYCHQLSLPLDGAKFLLAAPPLLPDKLYLPDLRQKVSYIGLYTIISLMFPLPPLLPDLMMLPGLVEAINTRRDATFWVVGSAIVSAALLPLISPPLWARWRMPLAAPCVSRLPATLGRVDSLPPPSSCVRLAVFARRWPSADAEGAAALYAFFAHAAASPVPLRWALMTACLRPDVSTMIAIPIIFPGMSLSRSLRRLLRLQCIPMTRTSRPSFPVMRLGIRTRRRRGPTSGACMT